MKEVNVALILPLFYEYPRRLRQGVLSWVDEHPGWRLIEIDPGTEINVPKVAGHFSGMITCIPTDRADVLQSLAATGLPMIDCGPGRPNSGTSPTIGEVTFDRSSMNDLAVEHFASLGLEVIGYVGRWLRENGEPVERVSTLRSKGLAAGMEWVEHDLGDLNPTYNWEWIWKASQDPALVKFLTECPKPVGLLTQDDYYGVMICEAAKSLGLKVPGDLVVLGQGDRVVGRSGVPTLSSVVIPGHEIGRNAAEMLDGWMKTGRKPRHLVIPCTKIAMRESTGGLSLDLGIERAKRHLELNAMNGATVGELAAIAGCSVRTLRSRFKAVYAIDPADTMREMRRNHALKLLAGSDLAISEIAHRCGFMSAPNFFNFVKRQSGGLGPADYRRAHRTVPDPD